MIVNSGQSSVTFVRKVSNPYFIFGKAKLKPEKRALVRLLAGVASAGMAAQG